MKSGLFAAFLFLGSFNIKLLTDVHHHLLLGSVEHIFILALVCINNGEYVSFEVLAGPDF